jgi:hypothetical protein
VSALREKSVDATTRNPLFLFLLFGLFLLRTAQRAFPASLLKEPPRNTRGVGELIPAIPATGR